MKITVARAEYVGLSEMKTNNAPSFIVWGEGKTRREFDYVDDMALASVHFMNVGKAIYDQRTEPICRQTNFGIVADLTINALAETIKEILGCQGDIFVDSSKPDGSPHKLMDSQRLNSLGQASEVIMEEGVHTGSLSNS